MIEHATLLKIAKDAAVQRMQARPSLISAYLTGSVAASEPLLGEATDIDLILIDARTPSAREVTRLTDQVVLDIQYRSKAEYANPKELRIHPWRGPEMCEPLFLYDSTHFFELAQASARGQFHRPDHVAARARKFAAWAREELHVGLLPDMPPSSPVTFASLCRSMMYSANAVISLTGFPGAGRRLALKLESAARKLARPDLADDFTALWGGGALSQSEAGALLADWSAAYGAGTSAQEEMIHPARRTIYERGFRAQIQADRAADGLWLMLYTWQACLKNLPGDSPTADLWAAFLERLHMASPAEFSDRVSQARAYASLADQAVEAWAEQNGA